MRLFDAHCHLQDPRIFTKAQHLIKTTQDTGVVYFVVNGVCEQDWHSVKHMAETFPCVIPSFGVHPWWSPIVCVFVSLSGLVQLAFCWWVLGPMLCVYRYVKERSPNWFKTLREYFDSTPSAAVGEVIVWFMTKGVHQNWKKRRNLFPLFVTFFLSVGIEYMWEHLFNQLWSSTIMRMNLWSWT